MVCLQAKNCLPGYRTGNGKKKSRMETYGKVPKERFLRNNGIHTLNT